MKDNYTITEVTNKMNLLQKQRNERGYEIFKADGVDKISETHFIVESATEKGKYYKVDFVGQTFCCTCPDYEKRSSFLECKHIMAVNYYITCPSSIRATLI